MRLSALILITGALTACGGSQDVCQQGVSVLQSASAKVKSCDADNSQEQDALTKAQTQEASCQASLKSCSAGDISAIQDQLNCQQTLIGTIQCKWYTEADLNDDPSYQTYLSTKQTCTAKTANVSPACGGD